MKGGKQKLTYPTSFLARPVINKPRLIKLFATQSRFYKERRQSTFDEPLELFMFDENWQAALDRFFSSKWFNLVQSREMLTGADVVYQLLMGLDLETAMSNSRSKWKELAKKAPEGQSEVIQAQDMIPQVEEERERDQAIQQQKDAIIKRLILIRDVHQTTIHPEWTILFNLPVLPPDLRPIVELQDGQLIRSDLNELYRIILQRNQLISQFSVEAPSCVSMMQKRLLQEAVDALLANGAGGNIIRDRNMRAYKSISDIIKGKKGRFRENLLGKRVDYSGRSVIVVGPSLALHQCGLPREMAIELFQPFLIRSLIIAQFARNPRAAKSMIQQKQPIVWKILKNVVNNHIIILNRAPTLHRLGIQAFQPILVKERAIHLHPLVCSGFNADFDGDQMAVHVPLSLEAQAEAHLLMSPYLNLLSSATADAITLPSQDMLLGLYALTLNTTLGVYTKRFNASNSIHSNVTKVPIYKNYNDIFVTNQKYLPDSPLWLYWMTNIQVISTLQDETAIEMQYESQGTTCSIYEHSQVRVNRLGYILSKYIRTTAGRIIFNQQIEQAIQGTEQLEHKLS